MPRSSGCFSIGDYCLTELVARKGKFAFPNLEVAGAPASYLRYAYHFDAALYATFLRRYDAASGASKAGYVKCSGRRRPVT